MAHPAHSRHVALFFLLALTLTTLALSASAHADGDTAQAWGRNATGQLGNGTVSNTGCFCIPSPVAVSGLSGATRITGGNDHSLALLSDGTVRAWGDESSGALGNGSTSSVQSTPVSVNGLSGVTAISAGDYHSLALLANGTVVAWGYNGDGELGNGTPSTSGCYCIDTPAPVSGLSGVVAVSSGYADNVALLANGTVMAWGYNADGELGNGAASTTGCHCNATPAPVPGLSGVVAISSGYAQNFALLANGTVMAWGYNHSGELGNGSVSTTGCSCIATPVAVSGLTGVTAITGTAGGGMALLSDGTVRAWGDNHSGELGSTPSPTPQPTPVEVNGLSGVTAIANGEGSDTSLALLGDGTVRAWGYNLWGSVGNGTTSTTGCFCIETPTAVSGLSGATAIGSGDAHGLALVGPSQRLHLALAGAGSGAVGGSGILCPPSCSLAYPQGGVATLLAVPNAGSRFAGFSGACTGTGPCLATLSQDQSVTATFGPPKGTRITRARVSQRKHSARFSFKAPGAITGFQCRLSRPRRKHHKPPARFTRCSAPKKYKHLLAGRYTFTVRALDRVGADPKPARKRFRIKP